MKIMITGSSGFIGGTLKKLMEKDHEIVSYDLKEELDILDVKKLEKKMKGCDSVVHLAALTSVQDSLINPSKYYETNIVGTSNVFETAIKLGIKMVIYASSSAIYGATESPYGASKFTNELLATVRKDKIRTIGFRFFNVYGSGMNLSYGAVIPNFIEGINKTVYWYIDNKWWWKKLI